MSLLIILYSGSLTPRLSGKQKKGREKQPLGRLTKKKSTGTEHSWGFYFSVKEISPSNSNPNLFLVSPFGTWSPKSLEV